MDSYADDLASNPGGLPIDVFDGQRAGSIAATSAHVLASRILDSRGEVAERLKAAVC